MAETAGLPDAGRVRLAFALRNCGAEYASTRHNAGDWFLSRLAAGRGAEFSMRSRLSCEEGRADGLRLARNCSYMNESGRAAAAIAGFYRIDPAGILIIHDEMDLPAGRARLKFSGGIAGHNGLRDVRACLGSLDFWRLRIGIGRPPAGADPSDYVLAPPSAEQRQLIDAAIEDIISVWPAIVAGDMNAAMLSLHTEPTPDS